MVNEGLIEESNLLSELIRQQRTVIDRELDFRIEAGNHRRMLGVYKNYSRNRLQEWVQSRRFLSRDPSGGNERLELDWSIRPPKIHGTYVNRSPENVLMTEVVEGVAFDKFPDSLDLSLIHI